MKMRRACSRNYLSEQNLSVGKCTRKRACESPDEGSSSVVEKSVKKRRQEVVSSCKTSFPSHGYNTRYASRLPSRPNPPILVTVLSRKLERNRTSLSSSPLPIVEVTAAGSSKTLAPKKASKLKDLPVVREVNATNYVQDDEHHLVLRKNDVVFKRYQILAGIGSGTFGRVYVAKDLKCSIRKKNEYAIKIMQATVEAKKDWTFEKKYLEKLREWDPQGKQPFVKIEDSFVFLDHPCIVTEKLGPSLLKFQQDGNNQSMHLNIVRIIAQQLCSGLTFLHERGLTHTDLKLENIVFVKNPTRLWKYVSEARGRKTKLPQLQIKIIDFGSAVLEGEHHTTTVTTLQYRAPEVLVAFGWDHFCDSWSVGCILYELYAGKPLFTGQSSREQLALMTQILGKLPRTFMRTEKSINSGYFHIRSGKVKFNPGHSFYSEVVPLVTPLMQRKGDCDPVIDQFFDLLSRLLTYIPSNRITMTDALHHLFLSSGR